MQSIHQHAACIDCVDRGPTNGAAIVVEGGRIARMFEEGEPVADSQDTEAAS